MDVLDAGMDTRQLLQLADVRVAVAAMRRVKINQAVVVPGEAGTDVGRLGVALAREVDRIALGPQVAEAQPRRGVVGVEFDGRGQRLLGTGLVARPPAQVRDEIRPAGVGRFQPAQRTECALSFCAVAVRPI